MIIAGQARTDRAAKAIHGGRWSWAAWTFARGMTILELNGRFPADAELDAAWHRGLTSLSPAGS